MKQFLIYCEYDYDCQGMDDTFGYFLVRAKSFEEACRKLKAREDNYFFSNPRNFQNHTID